MAATTTMHFGPEWMRTKQQQSSRTQPPPSPPPAVNVSSGASTYSALVSPATTQPPEKRDEAHPFRYSKEDLLRIYKAGSRGGLGLEVERWEGVVREVGSEPISLREMTEVEKKLFAGPLNSDLRRRQSNDLLSSLSTTSHGSERHRGNHNNSVAGSPLRERFGSLMRRRDSTDQPSSTAPNKLSTSGPPPILTPRDSGQPSPRPRVGFASNFDGVLNGGESWVARRRTSEGYLKGAHARGEAAVRDAQSDSKGSEIKEDEKEKQEESNESDGTGLSWPIPLSPSMSSQRQLKEGFEGQLVSAIPNDSSSTSDTRSNSSNGMDVAGGQLDLNSAPDTNAMDLASVEWSYLDPQGQVQGPFRADLMQKWYDEGYFIPELLMKRTNIDAEWMAVAELSRCAGGNKVFMSQQMAAIPPGLSRPLPNSVMPAEITEQYQPYPIRSLLPGTLDAYVASGSTPDSQQFFGGGAFGNGSPENTSRGMPAHHSYPTTDGSAGSRVAGFTPVSDPIPFATMGRNTYHDPSPDPSIAVRPSYSHTIVSGRSSTLDAYTFPGAYNPSPSPNWPSPNLTGPQSDGATQTRSTIDPAPLPSGFSSSVSSGPSLVEQGAYASGQEVLFVENNTVTPSNQEYSMGDYAYQRDTQCLSRAPEDGDLPVNPGVSNFANEPFTSSSPSQPYAMSAPVQYPASPPQQQSSVQLSTRYVPSLHTVVPAPQPVVNTVTNRPPWITQDSTAVRRPDPFGPPHPTSANTVPIKPPTPPQGNWGRPSQTSLPSSLPSEQSPWFVASKGALDEDWKSNASREGLTSKNVAQRSQLRQELGATVECRVNTQDLADHQQHPLFPETAPPPVGPLSQVTVKSRRKSAAQTQPPVSKPSPILVPISKSPSSPSLPSAPLKTAWLNEDETKKAKSAHTSVSLRDIQEAEFRKNESRKAAERERERQSRSVVSPASVDDLQPFSTTWGLPTSQAGVARNTASQNEISGVTSSASAPSTSAVWTNTSKLATAKKSMKQIQEEEEQRKKNAVKETVASAAARRGYSETIKPTPSSTGGGAWTTVGAGGKIPPPVTAAGRPPPSSTPTTSVVSNPTRANGVLTSRSSTAAVSTKATPTPSKPEEPASPSHDFLKWLSESLKGLNNSVNVEEIVSMLLSFPLDPDSSTMEIISDLIYANSTTLDGRRFASEFVNKRKADAASRQRGSGGSGSARPVSIADVVKAQPKPTQPEWGGFKVVNKKKRGGRS